VTGKKQLPEGHFKKVNKIAATTYMQEIKRSDPGMDRFFVLNYIN